MKRLACTLLTYALSLIASAQIRVTGLVTDIQSGKPLAKVIVSARDKDNKTKSFVQTKADGTYMLTATSNPATLHFSIIGYKKKTIPFVS